MILTGNINEVTRKVTFEQASAVVAVVGDYDVNGVAFGFPASYEDDFDLSTGVKTVFYEATDGTVYNHVITDTDSDTGLPLWVFTDEINKGAAGTVKFAIVIDDVEDGTIVKRWVSLITKFEVKKSIEIDTSEQEQNEQTYSERLAYLMTQVAAMQTVISGISSGTPTAVSTVAEMTDTSLLYLYTGSESGYTAGNWYYYNGSAWTSGGAYGNSAEVIAARTNAVDGTTYTDLQTRLDTENSALKADLIAYNATDLCARMTKTTTTYKGITYTWNSDGSCTVSGTATAISKYDLFSNTSALPDGIAAGDTVHVKYSGTNVKLVVYDCSNGTASAIRYTYNDCSITIPDDCTGLLVRLWVASGTTVDETVNPVMLNTYTNAELAERIESLVPKGIIPRGTDLNSVTTVGTYFVNSSYNYVNNPMPNTAGATMEVFVGTGSITVQRISRYDYGEQFIRTSDTQGSFEGRAWNGVVSDYIASKGDTTDRTDEIQAVLDARGICRLGPGDFYVTGIDIPDNGMLIGSGNSTRLILASSVEDGYAVKMLNYACVKDMLIMGAEEDITLSETVGTRHGILYLGTATSSSDESTRRYYGSLENLFITNFSGGAITCKDTGGKINSNIVATDIHIRKCNAGINIERYSEFHRFTNISVTGCWYGCICNGGNCNFVNCNFSANFIGILIDDTDSQAPNNSHGTFDACTICHSSPSNTGTAIKLLGIDNGEIFSGLQIFFGAIVIDSCVGVRFIGSNFGRTTPMTITDSTLVTFSDCTMTDATGTTVTQSGNTSLIFTGCYNKDGSVFNPLATA